MLAAVRRFCEIFDSRDCIITSDYSPAVAAFFDGAGMDAALETANREGDGEASELAELFSEEQKRGWNKRGYWRVPPLA